MEQVYMQQVLLIGTKQPMGVVQFGNDNRFEI